MAAMLISQKFVPGGLVDQDLGIRVVGGINTE